MVNNVIRLGQPSGDDVIRLGGRPTGLSFRERVERGLIAQTAVTTGILAGGATALINPVLAIPTFLGTTAGTASLLGAIRERPGFFLSLITGRGGAKIVRPVETIKEIIPPIVIPDITPPGLTAKEIAALIAAAAAAGAAGAGAATVIPKIVDIVKDDKDKTPKDIPTEPPIVPPTFFQVDPSGLAPTISRPISAVQPVSEKPVVKEKPMQITNEISVNPEINISFKKTKRFINQQINV